MTSRPAAGLLDQLTPFLGSLARLVAMGSQLSETELNMLLLCVGMESDAAALEELTRWGRLLAALHQNPPDSLRRAAVEGLILRGLPEAAVLAAVSIVAESASASTAATHSIRTEAPKANDGRSDPGILGPDESAPAGKALSPEDRGFTISNVPGWARVEPAGGERHLPIYLLLDISSSMEGAPIESVRQGLEQFQREVSEDQFARDCIKVGIIAFGSEARLVTDGLVPISVFQPPVLLAGGVRRLDLAFSVLLESMERDVVKAVKGGQKGDWKPAVFVLTDGRPTDESGYESDSLWPAARDAVVNRPKGQIKPSTIVAVGCGPNVDDDTLKEMSTGTAFRMGTSEASFVSLFQWITQSIAFSPQAGKLTASVERLDFGTLAPGQSGSLRFEVRGGQGQIFVEGEQIRVTPQKFGPKPTRIRVEVKPRSGYLLWGKLSLVTVEETVRVEVLAQWESQPQIPEVSLPTGPAPAPAPPSPSLGDSRIRRVDRIVMVYVPGGEFQMGYQNGDRDERPVHRVALRGFWLDRTPVTNSQYAAFLNKCGNRIQGGVTWINLGSDRCRILRVGTDHKVQPGYANHPVVEVSWHGATAYAEWAGARLPTEAEWEYAARGSNSAVIYPWGNRLDGKRANCVETGLEDTMPAGSFLNGAGWCGALDLAGNVWEWVADWYGRYPSRHQVNPTGPKSGQFRVLRGGSWDGNVRSMRSTFRLRRAPDFANLNVGFRCATSL